MNDLNLKHLKNKLTSIGSKSLRLIEKHRVNKGESWSLAIEINTIAHDLHDQLEKDSNDEGMWDEYLAWCRNQENASHEG